MAKIMSVTRQIATLKRLGLPYLTKAQRKASWIVFQEAQTWTAPLDPDGVPGPLTTAAVNMAAKHNYRVSPHFHLREFACPHCGKVKVARKLLVALEKVRKRNYPTGLRIVSGYRCAKHNAKVGGIPTSAHLKGEAADIPAKFKPDNFKGLGLHGIGYKARHGLVTHVDVKTGLKANTIFREDY